MAFQFHKIPSFTGLSNRKDFRDIGNGLSKAQNISLDVGGKIRTIGGLADFTKVDGTTALTQTAKIAPGSGLFKYGSDHWRGTDTIVDLIATSAADDSAASDEYGEVDDVGDWIALGGGTLVSQGVVVDEGSFALHHNQGVSTQLAFAGGSGGIPVVVGQKYKFHARSRSDSGGDAWRLGTTTTGIDIWRSDYGLGTDTWETFETEFIASTNRVHILYYHSGSTDSYMDNVYLTAISRRDLSTNWLALADVANAQVDLYNSNNDSFTAALLDFGAVFSYVATIDTINFPTTKTITDSTSQFLNQGIQVGDIRIISGSALNNIMFVVEHVTAGTITARGNPFVVDVDDDGTITLTKYNPVAFHYVNEALRASPVGGGVALRPKHYSFADRIHFEDTGASERKFSNWFLNDVGPVAPTSASAHTTNGNVATQAELVAGTGFEVGITRTANDGDWIEGTYIIAIAFKYDDGQISALYVPTADEEFGTTIVDGDSLTLTVRGKMSASVDYDERISGGYVFCRLDESDEPWSLFADISMAKGARATLSGTYNAWAESSTVYEAYTANFKSLRLNVEDSYESLAGIDPTTLVEVFTGDNAFWNTSVIARNRCFIGSVRYTAEGGALSHFRDRILYSQAGAYDTFPIKDNYIDVVQGDAEDYVKLGAYGNDLLCFKESTLYIVDISDPDDAGWQMKQDVNKGKYPFRGIAHPGAYFETPHGPAWCNKFGVFLYNGSEIVPLLGDKIELSEHPLAYQRYMEFATNDYISKSNDADLNFGANTDFSLEVIFKSSAAGSTQALVMKGDIGGNWYALLISSNNLFQGIIDDGVGAKAPISTTTVTDGEWHHGIVVFDRDSATGGKLYLDGVAKGTDQDLTGVGDIDDAGQPLAIGIQANDLSTWPFDGDIALARIWNRKLTAAEVLALYNGQPVLAADRDGSQTGQTSGVLETGQRYRITTYVSADDFTNVGAASNATGVEFIATGTTPDDWTNGSTLNPIGCVAEYAPKGIGDATWTDQSDNSLDGTVVGATAIYEDSWAKFYTDYSILGYHALTNQLIIMRDCTGKWSSGKDYSDGMIIDLDTGAITTGRRIFAGSTATSGTLTVGSTYEITTFVSGDDFTNVGAASNATGVVFTATDDDTDGLATPTTWSNGSTLTQISGIIFSNFATDWDQGLIIAEQFGATVHLRRWTDEPQSQAAGLIDVRTADIDFGNPMFAKIFDAFVVTYKSLAAQTTPVSYATNGNDLNIAWTRLTGNFSASEIWKKLSLQPTPITVDTIRFKLDNPTAATKIEINDVGIRYDEEPEDID